MEINDILFRKTEEARTAFSLFEKNDKVLVALSGGADSVSLLLMLKKFYPGLSLYACHVNHMLRGKSADNDEKLAGNLCKRESIPFELLKTDVKKAAEEKGESTELAARNIRYGFFEKVSEKYGITKVATAHTLSDNAETVLFNLARGTALSGLCGIPPKRKLSERVEIIRPLIFITRAEVEEFLKNNNENYVTDETNLTDDYSRNYIRHNIVPKMKKLNPSFESGLKKLCGALRETQIFLEGIANNSMTDDISKLSQLDEVILRRVICKLYEQKGFSGLENIHVENIANMVRECAKDRKKSGEICLPGKMSALVSDGRLCFAETVRYEKKILPDEYKVQLQFGFNKINNTPFAVCLCKASDTQRDFPEISANREKYFLFDSVIMDETQICGELYVRNRINGDRLKSGGMTRKLKELYNRKKLPSELREILPVFCDGNGIVYVPRVAVDDKHKLAVCNSQYALRLLIYSESPL